MNIGIFIGVAGAIAVFLFRDWFFGDDAGDKGFPWTRRKK
jgi:hypothetical protein